MPTAEPCSEIKVFLCRNAVSGKMRAVLHGVIPAVGELISIGQQMFKVEAVVHPLNLYDGGLRGDRAIDIYVEPTTGGLFAGAENYDEVSVAELATNSWTGVFTKRDV